MDVQCWYQKVSTILLRRKSLWPVESRSCKKKKKRQGYTFLSLKCQKPSKNYSVAIKIFAEVQHVKHEAGPAWVTVVYSLRRHPLLRPHHNPKGIEW